MCNFSVFLTPLYFISLVLYPSGHYITIKQSLPGVNSDGLLDDETVLDQLPDVLPGVGVGNLADLVRIQPNLETR